ncbi:MAG: argininosuccinate lyase [Bacteroidota bacterium]
MKLWQKGAPNIDELFERFTIGKDPELDMEIAAYDVIATKAHVEMLASISLLSDAETKLLVAGLDEIYESVLQKKFVIEEGIEDCHSQIELLLTRKLGEVGKKVHSGRSRNDQVLVALKLYAKAELEKIAFQVRLLFELLQRKSDANKNVLMPGYTHMQVAMPSSFGLWFGAYAESLIDDLILLKAAYQIADKNPLGSAAGYGSSFPLDREKTTRDLGFRTPNYNVIYAQMTRGKMEKACATAISSLAATLAKFSMDVCTYAGQDFGFFKLDPKFTTGSSIMPHKQNPDGFELVRAKCNQLQSLPTELQLILTNLNTGYHRDLQILKESLVKGFQTMLDCLAVMQVMVGGLKVSDDLIEQNKYDLLFTVEEVNKRVLKGIPFRDAYKEVGALVNSGKYVAEREVSHSHLGSIGNLATEQIKAAFDLEFEAFER